MKFYVISDTHGNFDYPEINADCILLLGDIAKTEMRFIDEKYDIPKFFVFGNNDTRSHVEGTNIVEIHNEVIDFDGLKIGGFGGIPRTSNKNLYYEFVEKDVESFVDKVSEIDVFISHANPMWKVDIDKTNSHRGFNEFMRLIEEKKPHYFLHGHNHRPYEKQFGDTKVVCVYKVFEFELNKIEK